MEWRTLIRPSFISLHQEQDRLTSFLGKGGFIHRISSQSQSSNVRVPEKPYQLDPASMFLFPLYHLSPPPVLSTSYLPHAHNEIHDMTKLGKILRNSQDFIPIQSNIHFFHLSSFPCINNVTQKPASSMPVSGADSVYGARERRQ